MITTTMQIYTLGLLCTPLIAYNSNKYQKILFKELSIFLGSMILINLGYLIDMIQLKSGIFIPTEN